MNDSLMSTEEQVPILEAEFNPDVRKYWLLSGVLALLASIVGIPLIILWWILGLYLTQRYLDHMQCVLTDKSLIVRKGIFVRVEKIVPLEKITDLGMIQGPVMRYFNIEKMTVETAGQSSQGALISLTGIRGAAEFRNTVLRQRDKQRVGPEAPESASARTTEPETTEILVDIRDSLARIEDLIASR